MSKQIYIFVNITQYLCSYHVICPTISKKKNPKFGFKMYISGNYNQLHEMIITGEYVIVFNITQLL